MASGTAGDVGAVTQNHAAAITVDAGTVTKHIAAGTATDGH